MVFIKNSQRMIFVSVFLVIAFLAQIFITQAQAASRAVINAEVYETVKMFERNVPGSNLVLNHAKGLLVFPKIYQGGLFWIGGQYGDGALVEKRKMVDYYRIAAGSFGPQLGGQVKSVIIAFLTPQAYESFRLGSGWKVGADASIAVIAIGAEGSITTDQLENKPVVAFVFDQKGLMYNFSLVGSKIFKIKTSK